MVNTDVFAYSTLLVILSFSRLPLRYLCSSLIERSQLLRRLEHGECTKYGILMPDVNTTDSEDSIMFPGPQPTNQELPSKEKRSLMQ